MIFTLLNMMRAREAVLGVGGMTLLVLQVLKLVNIVGGATAFVSVGIVWSKY